MKRFVRLASSSVGSSLCVSEFGEHLLRNVSPTPLKNKSKPYCCKLTRLKKDY